MPNLDVRHVSDALKVEVPKTAVLRDINLVQAGTRFGAHGGFNLGHEGTYKALNAVEETDPETFVSSDWRKVLHDRGIVKDLEPLSPGDRAMINLVRSFRVSGNLLLERDFDAYIAHLRAVRSLPNTPTADLNYAKTLTQAYMVQTAVRLACPDDSLETIVQPWNPSADNEAGLNRIRENRLVTLEVCKRVGAHEAARTLPPIAVDSTMQIQTQFGSFDLSIPLSFADDEPSATRNPISPGVSKALFGTGSKTTKRDTLRRGILGDDPNFN